MIKVVLHEVNRGVKVDDTSRYERILQDLREDLGEYSAMPVTYALEGRNNLLLRGRHSKQELLSALETLQSDDVPPSLKKQVTGQRLQYTSMALGNIGLDE